MSFVDTNVLVYATADSAPFRNRARAALARQSPLPLAPQLCAIPVFLARNARDLRAIVEEWPRIRFSKTREQRRWKRARSPSRRNHIDQRCEAPKICCVEGQQPALAMRQHSRDNIGIMNLTTSEGRMAAQLHELIPHQRAVLEDGKSPHECRSVRGRLLAQYLSTDRSGSPAAADTFIIPPATGFTNARI